MDRSVLIPGDRNVLPIPGFAQAPDSGISLSTAPASRSNVSRIALVAGYIFASSLFLAPATFSTWILLSEIQSRMSLTAFSSGVAPASIWSHGFLCFSAIFLEAEGLCCQMHRPLLRPVGMAGRFRYPSGSLRSPTGVSPLPLLLHPTTTLTQGGDFMNRPLFDLIPYLFFVDFYDTAFQIHICSFPDESGRQRSVEIYFETLGDGFHFRVGSPSGAKFVIDI